MLAPTPDDLAAAYELPGPAGTHEFAAGLVPAGELLVVLGTAGRSRLVGVDPAGTPQWTIPVPVAGRALAGDLVLGELPTSALTVRAAVARLGTDRRGLAVAVHPDSRIAVAGQRRHDPEHRVLTVTLLHPDGTTAWDRDAGSGGADTAAGVVLTATRVAVAYSSPSPGATTRVRLLTLAPDGTLRWDRDL